MTVFIVITLQLQTTYTETLLLKPYRLANTLFFSSNPSQGNIRYFKSIFSCCSTILDNSIAGFRIHLIQFANKSWWNLWPFAKICIWVVFEDIVEQRWCEFSLDLAGLLMLIQLAEGEISSAGWGRSSPGHHSSFSPCYCIFFSPKQIFFTRSLFIALIMLMLPRQLQNTQPLLPWYPGS